LPPKADSKRACAFIHPCRAASKRFSPALRYACALHGVRSVSCNVLLWAWLEE